VLSPSYKCTTWQKLFCAGKDRKGYSHNFYSSSFAYVILWHAPFEQIVRPHFVLILFIVLQFPGKIFPSMQFFFWLYCHRAFSLLSFMCCLHRFILYWFASPSIILLVLRKLFLNFNQNLTGVMLYTGCLLSVCSFVLSMPVATLRLTYDGAIPLSIY